MLRDRLWWWSAAVVVVAGALGGCKNGGAAPTGTEPVEPVVTDAGLEPNDGDDVWTPEAAAAAIGEAAAEAARGLVPEGAGGDRRAAIAAATDAAVDQAMLVAPDLGVNTEWRDAVGDVIAQGVGRTDAPGQPGAVLDEFIRRRVETTSLEWIRKIRSGGANPH